MISYEEQFREHGDVNESAIEHARTAKAATSEADEWKDELEDAAKARSQWIPEGYKGQANYKGTTEAAHGPRAVSDHPTPSPPSSTADWGTEASRIGNWAKAEGKYKPNGGYEFAKGKPNLSNY